MYDRSTKRSRNSGMRKVRPFPFAKFDPEADEKSLVPVREFSRWPYKKLPRGRA
jgi:hypothetical protein